MIDRQPDNRRKPAVVDIDLLVPKFHLLRKIERSMDWNTVYELVEQLYSKNVGRPSVDPVVLIKIVLLQHLYGHRSLRETVRVCEDSMAYRWFLGYGLLDTIPHFSTVSYNFLHRFGSDVFEQIFNMVLEQAIDSGYIKPEVIFVDGTHIKANANRKKQMKVHIPTAVKKYEEILHKEINEDREAHGKKPFDDDDDDNEDGTGTPSETREICQSSTDPESGLFHKGEHEKCFAYTAQTVCDANNFVLGVTVAPGNIHDSVQFDEIYKQVTVRFPEIEVVTADAGYKTPWICKQIFDDGRIPSLPYKRPMTKKGNLPWYEFVFDEYYDCILCPQYKVLSYSTTNREGYREYKSKSYICQSCPVRQQCTQSKNCQKIVTRHIWADYLERAEDVRHSPLGKSTYAMRSRTIERVFADAKEKHGMRYTTYRGLKQVTNWVRLKFAAMNLKKLAKWRFATPPFYLFFLLLSRFYVKTPSALAC